MRRKLGGEQEKKLRGRWGMFIAGAEEMEELPFGWGYLAPFLPQEKLDFEGKARKSMEGGK